MRFARARPFSVGSCLTYRLPPTSARVCTRPRLTWPKDSRCHDTSSPTATFSSRASSAHGGLFHFELMSHVGGAPLRRVVVVTSINRLVTARPYSAPHVEAPDPDIIMRRSATSERTVTPAPTSTRRRWKPPVRSGQIPCGWSRMYQVALGDLSSPLKAPAFPKMFAEMIPSQEDLFATFSPTFASPRLSARPSPTAPTWCTAELMRVDAETDILG
jgi:hypothetical protein